MALGLATISLPKNIIVGGGSTNRLEWLLKLNQSERPLLVTEKFFLNTKGFELIQSILARTCGRCVVFDQVVPDPTTVVVEAGVRALKENQCDSIVAFGGGSSLDTAKAISVLATHGGKMSDYKVPASPLHSDYPVIAIPTTAGTGAEVTRVVVIVDPHTDEKMLCMGEAFLPAAAIVDFHHTFEKPFRLTADTGLDTLTHAIEAFVSKKSNPFTDSIALACMKAVVRHLRTACANPADETAREAMMLAATQGGIAFANSSVCLVHGMSRPLGHHFHIPHGLSNAMLLPVVTRYSAPFALARYGECARVMGFAADTEDDQRACDRMVESLIRLNLDLKVPSLREFGVQRETYFGKIDLMVEQAIASGSPANNPGQVSGQDIKNLYTELWPKS